MLLEAAANFATGRGLKLTKDSYTGCQIWSRPVAGEEDDELVDSDDKSPSML